MISKQTQGNERTEYLKACRVSSQFLKNTTIASPKYQLFLTFYKYSDRLHIRSRYIDKPGEVGVAIIHSGASSCHVSI